MFADAAWLQEKQLGFCFDCSVCRKAKSRFKQTARPMNLEALADLLVPRSKNGGECKCSINYFRSLLQGDSLDLQTLIQEQINWHICIRVSYLLAVNNCDIWLINCPYTD